MSTPEEPTPTGRSGSGRRWLIVALVAVVVVVAAAATGVYLLVRSATDVPEFAALADAPDTDLSGTVAYLDWEYGPCLNVVAASGAPSKQLGCLGEDAVEAKLLWLPDGQLQVTNGDSWQRVYDVRTGEFEEVPAASIDPDAATWDPVTVNNEGDKVTATSGDGTASVIVTSNDGTVSTVMSAEGGDTYSISTTPTWSPDGTYVLLTDAAARILVVTPDDATTRVLAEELGNSWAITGDDLLNPDN
jgi:hypothetical protein